MLDRSRHLGSGWDRDSHPELKPPELSFISFLAGDMIRSIAQKGIHRGAVRALSTRTADGGGGYPKADTVKDVSDLLALKDGISRFELESELRSAIKEKDWDAVLKSLRNKHLGEALCSELPVNVWNSIINKMFSEKAALEGGDEWLREAELVLKVFAKGGSIVQTYSLQMIDKLITKLLSTSNNSGFARCCELIDVFEPYMPPKKLQIFYDIMGSRICKAFFDENERDACLAHINTLKAHQITRALRSIKVALTTDNCMAFFTAVMGANSKLPGIDVGNAFLSLLSWNKNSADAEKFFNYLKSHGNGKYHPNDASVLMMMGVYARLNEGPKAIALLEEAEASGILDVSRKMKDIYLLIAISYRTNLSKDTAIKRSFASLSRTPNVPDALYFAEMVRAMSYSNDYPNIGKYYKKLRELDIKPDAVLCDNCAIRAKDACDTELASAIAEDLICKRTELPFFTICTILSCLSGDPPKLLHYFETFRDAGLIQSPLVVISYLQSISICANEVPNAFEHARDITKWAYRNKLCATELVNTLIRLSLITGNINEVESIFNEYFVVNKVEITPKTVSVLGVIDSTPRGEPDGSKSGSTSPTGLSSIAYKMLTVSKVR